MNARFRTFLALALGVVTVAAAEKARTYQTGAQWLVVVAIVVAFVIVLCAAGGAVYGVASAAATEWWWRRRAARYTPPERPLWLTTQDAMDPLAVDASLHWNDVYAAWALGKGEFGHDARHAARQASDEAAQPAPVRDVPTVPMPIVVVDAQPWPWSPPVAEPVSAGAQRGRT